MATSELPLGAAKSSHLNLGEIEIASPFEPAVVLENLRARQREWRQSSVPEALKPYKVGSLAVDVSGSEFSLRWVGSTSPFYNPVCFGTVEAAGQGSRIKAGFKLDLKAIFSVSFLVPMAILQLVGDGSLVSWIILAAALLLLVPLARGSSHKAPLRAHLIEVLTTAARQKAVTSSPFSSTMSTNGP
jgi:hypothetical protein